MIIDPPQPPQKQIFPSGIQAMVSFLGNACRLGQRMPTPQRSGMPRTTSTALACSLQMRSIVSGPSRRMPSTSPPRAIADSTRATERAFPCPFTAPMSARRRPGVLASFAVRDPVPVLLGGTDLEVGTQRPGELLGDEPLQGLSTHAPDDLAEQVTEVRHVVARGRSRLPPRGLSGHPGRGLLPVVEVLEHGWLIETGAPGGVTRAPAARLRAPSAETATEHLALGRFGATATREPGGERVGRSGERAARGGHAIAVCRLTTVADQAPSGTWLAWLPRGNRVAVSVSKGVPAHGSFQGPERHGGLTSAKETWDGSASD